MTDPDDIWLNAFAAWPEDPRPLARLLRSTPMTPRAQDILANLLDPHDPPSDAFILKAVRNPKWDRMLGAGYIDKVPPGACIEDFDPQKRDDGDLGVVARHVGLNVGGRTKHVCAQQIRRYRAKFARLGKYLHGQD